MQQKINILIGTAIITLLGLISIQAYLIYNTYELKKDAFLNETKKVINRIDDETASLNDIEEIWGLRLMGLLADYKYGSLSKEEFIFKLTKTADSSNAEYNRLYKEQLAKSELGYDVKYKKNIHRIILLDSVQNDTIYSLKENKPVFLVGENFDDATGYRISNARWQSNYQEESRLYGGEPRDVEFEFRVDTQDRMNISEWKRIVLGRMVTILVGSILLLLFVVGLFYYSISNLIKQKKVADVKTDFINNITHELKTPLATLAIATKSLKKQEIVEAPEAFENTLGIVERQNSRLQKLIDQVMTNSLGSEDLVLHKEQLVDDVYFKNIVSDFSLSVQSKDLNIALEIEPKEVMLRIDRFLFTTALLNILENAVKYGKETVAIKVQTQLKNNQYQIDISDNGIGISEKNKEVIFDKFYRVTSGNVHNVKGLGLGLYYTKQVIDAHSGEISLQSELHKGTAFSIIIPVN